MAKLPETFGSMVFNWDVMKQRLKPKVYDRLKATLAEGGAMGRDMADEVADAMKDWAVEHGATHYTHWFQPMTGVTAEKHEAFLAPSRSGVILEFSGKELIKGEPDASSFPSGGLRATFEARGYTAWDPTSYAFIKDNTLCIPTAFCSYTGEALDKKTPLLRSMEALSQQAIRIMKLFGRDVKRVDTTIGAEQEYFLVDRSMFDRRPDLKYTGRTLVGARPPKGQEMDDHYFGALKPRVSAYMRELDDELWKLGVLAKTEHNETAPAQHELAPIFTTANIATDHNQLTMELMKRIAVNHNMACLLHEKPFAGVNGSGKHNNWSMTTDTGVNLLDPGETPSENAQFLLFLVAVIAAVDKHQDLLRISVASAGNDHRLGAQEAPPAIVSISLGEELTGVLEAIESDLEYDRVMRSELNIGVDVLPRLPKDTTDRNRTSPFAFTGNKFELRMLGSSFSIAGPNIVLNTIVADELRLFADELENARNFTGALNILIRDTIRRHKRILYGGNNYTDEWKREAHARGLLDWPTTIDAVTHFCDAKNLELFARNGVFTENEMRSRQEIYVENYVKTVRIEALTMREMIGRDLLPAVIAYSGEVAQGAQAKAALGVEPAAEKKLVARLCEGAQRIQTGLERLNAAIARVDSCPVQVESAVACRDLVCPAMEDLRADVDAMELIVAADKWPYPTYGEMLFSVR
ncbi:MAG: glutamine synthetase III [Eubacteriales bacterium]|nr:glutamine synthetase III [Eubacteriales bacterium]